MIADAAVTASTASSPRAVHCAHCGEPIGEGAREDTLSAGTPPIETATVDTIRFCCGGCRAVWTALHACGLEEYYRLRASSASPHDHRGPRAQAGPSPARASTRSRRELDAIEFLTRHVETLSPDRCRVELRIDGLRCGACIWLLEALPRLHAGVLAIRIDAGRAIAAIEWAPSRTALSEIARAIEQLGYALLPLRDRAERERERCNHREWLVRVGVASVLAINAMGIAFALYGGFFHGMDSSMRLFLQWTSLGLAAASVVGPGRLFLRNAWLALRTRVPHMDLPISLALLAALGGGIVSTLRGGAGVYAESLTMLVMLLLVGRFVQFRSQSRARHQVDLIASLIPSVARRIVPAPLHTSVSGDSAPTVADLLHEEVPVEALRAGDRVLVTAGESAGADGVLDERGCWADMQTLTGESRPVRLERGDRLWAGCRVLDQPVVMRVEVAGSATRAGRLMAMVDQAASRRAPVVEFANRVAGWFLAVVLLLALVTFVVWSFVDWTAAFEHTVALLVVTCPCALGLATPLTMVSSLAKAARVGILIKGGDALERLAGRGTVVLDKTGTLTEGSMVVVEQVGDARSMALAASLERQSAHPIARAIVSRYASCAASRRAAGERPRESVEPPREVVEVSGAGIRGVVGAHSVVIGRLDFAAPEAPALIRAQVAVLANRALTPVVIAIDGVCRAVLGLGDPLRPEAHDTIAALKHRGWTVTLASGDDQRTASAIAAEVGIAPENAHGGVTPEAKAALVSSVALRRPVVMVGDGVNDLAALSAADVGVSLGSGARASLEVGDVCLARDGIAALPPLLDGARRSMRVIHVNFAISLAYNVTGAALAMAGLMHPLLAAVLMPLSGLTVTAIALRAPRFRTASIH